MDIRCKHCGEPIDTFEFHSADTGKWQSWINQFKKIGCPVVDVLFDTGKFADLKGLKPCHRKPVLSPEGLETVAILTDLLGDDTDGLSTMLDDHIG